MDIKNIMQRIVVLLFLVVLFLYSLFFYYRLQREEEAQSFIYPSVQTFEKGKFYEALYGGSRLVPGFYGYMLQYYDTYAGNTSRIYAGICFIKLGKYELGIKCLLSAKIYDKVMRSKVLAFLADAYMEMKDYRNALKFYLEAASVYDSEIDTPIFLFKAVVAYEMLGEYEKALEQLKMILSKYRRSENYREFLEEQKKLDFVVNSKNK